MPDYGQQEKPKHVAQMVNPIKVLCHTVNVDKMSTEKYLLDLTGKKKENIYG
jgi:hypothetical protein